MITCGGYRQSMKDKIFFPISGRIPTSKFMMSQTGSGSTGSRWKTGVVYDESMAEPKCLWDDQYNERPERYTRVIQRYTIIWKSNRFDELMYLNFFLNHLTRCREYGLFERCNEIPPRDSTEAELLKLHTPEMISILKATEDSTDIDSLEELSSKYDFLYIHPVRTTITLYIYIFSLQINPPCSIQLLKFQIYSKWSRFLWFYASTENIQTFSSGCWIHNWAGW